MTITSSVQPFRRFVRSKRALALPVTFLILLASTLGIITVTYYFAVGNINTQSETLEVCTTKQDLLSLDNDILSTLGHPGSSCTVDLRDSGGSTNIQPTTNILTISVTDNSAIEQTIFNSSIGQVAYELPFPGVIETGLYIEGDAQTITNQSGSSQSQLYITNGPQGPEIQLQYRPTVTYETAGLQNGQAINDIRIYIVNLNSSDPITLQGNLPLQISCVSTQLTAETYNVPYQSESLSIISQLNGTESSVVIPIQSASGGSIIYIETVISNVSIERLAQ